MPDCRSLKPLANLCALLVAVSLLAGRTWSQGYPEPHNQNFNSAQPLPPDAPSAIQSASEIAIAEVASLNENSSPQNSNSEPPADQASSKRSQRSPNTASSSKFPGSGLYNVLQRKSLFFPDIANSDQRLSSAQKFELFVDNSISVSSVSVAVVGAAIGQADNSPTGYGQGWEAYAKRFGASMGRSASNEFFGTFVISSALHLDPRFYPEDNPSFPQAVKYSVQRVFIVRNDEGRDAVAWSQLVGPLMGESLANVYWPERNRSVGDTFFRYGVDLAVRAGGNMLKEYWPVVARKKIGRAHV